MKIGIVGTRKRDDHDSYKKVEQIFLSIYKEGDVIVSGGCSKGGDRFAEMIADKFGIPIEIHRANWYLGRHAGFLRNTIIAENSNVLIACIAKDRRGGTEDTIKKFVKFNSEDGLLLV